MTDPSTDHPTLGLPIRAPDGDVVTIGVAIPVPDPFATALRDRRADFGDPAAFTIPPHVTLLPPTEVALAAMPQIADHLGRVAAANPEFGVRLAGSATFRPVTPVVYVRLVTGATECDTLQQDIRSGPLARDLIYPYHPHVTVAQQVDDAALDRAEVTMAGYDAEFRADSLALYEHARDGVWRLRTAFPLGSGASVHDRGEG